MNTRVWLTRQEAADYARVSLSTIDRALRSGSLQRHKIQRSVRIKREHVDSWLHNGALFVLAVLILALIALPMKGCAGHRTQHRQHHNGQHVALAPPDQAQSRTGGRRRKSPRFTVPQG